MKHSINKFILSFALILTIPVSFAYASNPSSAILPSDNIQDPGDPGTSWGGCGPTDSNCYVTITNSQWTTTGSDIYYNTGNVGIGTDSFGTSAPTSLLDLKVSAVGSSVFSISNGSTKYFVANARASNTNAIGTSAGLNANNATNSNFFGVSAGSGATSASNSNFFGNNSGLSATGANNSNFFGVSAGNGANGASKSNFFGPSAGSGATGANNSNFFGDSAGYGTTDGYNSNFLGEGAGYNATYGNSSNFLGYHAGYGATYGGSSNFLGFSAGNGAVNSYHSNFFGTNAGTGATDASFSTLIGYHAGETFTSNNIGANNIIIGTNISLPNAAANAINIGGILFGAGTYSTLTGDPSITPVSTGKIGIGDVSPDYRLDVADTGIDNNIFSLTDSDGECLYNPEAGSVTVSCSSDARLKSNIVDTNSALSYFSDFHIKDYDVIASGDHMTGVIAQEVITNHPELVTVGTNGMYSVQLPNQWKVIKAIQELDMKVKGIENFNQESNPFGEKLKIWLANASNKITRIFTGEVCLTDMDGTSECINKNQLGQLKQLLNTNNTFPSGGSNALVIDLCMNIEGTQVIVPDGYQINTENNCVENDTIAEPQVEAPTVLEDLPNESPVNQ